MTIISTVSAKSRGKYIKNIKTNGKVDYYYVQENIARFTFWFWLLFFDF